MSTPEPPGPPKLNSSEPRRSSPVAFARIRASPIVGPSGFDQSSGTFSVAHCQPSLGAGSSPEDLQAPQSSADAPLPSSWEPPSPEPSPEPPPVQPAVSSPAATTRAVHRTKRV